MSKQRLDVLLVSRNLVESRELAQRLIIAGEVSVGGHPSTKPGLKVSEDAEIAIRNRPRYVSRGGLKMEGALQTFPITLEGKVCADIGASTGGFTDCLLQHGAVKVHAIDVGTNQLVWKLRQDPRVVVKEKFNARYMTPEDIGEQVDLIVSDVVYNPRKTHLLEVAEKKGCRTLNGLGMMLWQGARAFEIWTGKQMPVDYIKSILF